MTEKEELKLLDEFSLPTQLSVPNDEMQSCILN